MFAPRAGLWIGPPTVLAIALAIIVGRGLVEGLSLAVDLVVLAGSIGCAVFFAIFFRDPERRPGDGVVSAADGRVRAVEVVDGRLLISVFMNVTDVHVNRWPLHGTVTSIRDTGDGYRPAYRPDAAHNVQRAYRVDTDIGPIEVVQMTGVVARRLVSFVAVGAPAAKGARFGMIVLGSRVDVLLPPGRSVAAVKVGDRVRAGASTIARVVP